MAKQWRFKGHDSASILAIAKQSSVEPVVAQILLNRGITETREIDSFLEARFSDLREPELLPGVVAASERIYAAVQDKTPITIYGDYDADGMTGTSILFSCLRLLGAEVQYYVPNRLEDSYGLSCDSIQKLAQRGRKMIISVDCGIGSIREAELCRELSIDLIITDHHRLSDQLPAAGAIVHPALPGYDYPFHGLCGAGVAFKLSWAICQHASQAKKVSTALREFLFQATDRKSVV